MNVTAEASMERMKIAIAWWSFVPHETFANEFLRAAVDLGYNGIELAPQEKWGHIRDLGLDIVTVAGHDSIIDGLNRKENHARIEREINGKLDLAQQWGIKALICFSGSRHGLDDEAGAENTAEGLSRLVAAARDADVMLLLELLNSKVDHPDYQCDHTGWGVKVCTWVNSPRVKLLYDIYHMQIMEGDIIRTINKNHPFIGHYHVAGNPGRSDPDDTQEINYLAVYRAIAASHFNGYLGMEFTPELPSFNLFTSMKNAIEAVPLS
jgi:hydroxypyruvate isomerase